MTYETGIRRGDPFCKGKHDGHDTYRGKCMNCAPRVRVRETSETFVDPAWFAAFESEHGRRADFEPRFSLLEWNGIRAEGRVSAKAGA